MGFGDSLLTRRTKHSLGQGMRQCIGRSGVKRMLPFAVARSPPTATSLNTRQIYQTSKEQWPSIDKYQGRPSYSYVIITVNLLLYSNLPNASNHPHLFPSSPPTCPPSSAWTRISICRFLNGVLFLTPTPIILPGNLSNFHA